MEELNVTQMEEIIEAMRLAFIKSYMGADNFTSELTEELNERFNRGLCSIFAIALKEVIPSAELCKVDGLFGNHAFIKVGEKYYDGNGKFDFDSGLWNDNEKFFDIDITDLESLLPEDYFSKVEYYTQMIDILSESGKESLGKQTGNNLGGNNL